MSHTAKHNQESLFHVQVVHTFMRGCELIGRPTKPKFLLEPGELRALFEGPAKQRWDPLRSRWLDESVEEQMAPRWEVVMDDVRPISDGRPLSFFMATRVA